MTEPTLALQIAIRTQLKNSPVVTALVPPENILDRSLRPDVFPCIIIGEGDAIYSDHYNAFFDRAHLSIHVWAQGASTVPSKEIVSAIRDALGPVLEIPGFERAFAGMANARFIRDGDLSHAVIGIDAILRKRVT